MTISIKIKEIMNDMPDTLNTKKEIDDYYKDAMKKTLENNKLKEDNKPKKALNAYQIFMKENIAAVKMQNPNLTGPEVFSMIASMWKEQKELKVGSVEIKDADPKPVIESEKETKDVVDDISEITDAKEETKEVKKKEKKAK
jgi:hypothetical protein